MINYHKIPVRISFRKTSADNSFHIEQLDFQSAYEADGWLFRKLETDMGYLEVVLKKGGYDQVPTRVGVNFLSSLGFTSDIKIEKLNVN